MLRYSYIACGTEVVKFLDDRRATRSGRNTTPLSCPHLKDGDASGDGGARCVQGADTLHTTLTSVIGEMSVRDVSGPAAISAVNGLVCKLFPQHNILLVIDFIHRTNYIATFQSRPKHKRRGVTDRQDAVSRGAANPPMVIPRRPTHCNMRQAWLCRSASFSEKASSQRYEPGSRAYHGSGWACVFYPQECLPATDAPYTDSYAYFMKLRDPCPFGLVDTFRTFYMCYMYWSIIIVESLEEQRE